MIRTAIRSIGFVLALAAFASAQVDNGQQVDPNADRAAAFRQRMADRLQQQGIDPEQLRQQFGDTMQSLRDGTFNPAQLQQQLLDRGLVTPDQLAQYQNRAQQNVLGDLKIKLGADDDAWTVLQPRIVRLLQVSADMNRTTAGNQGGTVMISMPAASDVSKALGELRAVLEEPTSTPEMIAPKLKAYRTARENSRKEFEKAEKDLKELLTIAQETVMLSLGYID